MKTIHFLTAILLLLTSACTTKRQLQSTSKTDATAKIHFSKNVDFFGYLIQLAEPEEHDPNHPITPILAQGADDVSIPALMRIYEVGGHLPYDVFVRLFHGLPAFPLPENYTIPTEMLQENGISSKEDVEIFTALINYANEFYQASHFEQIWTQLAPHREATLAQLEDNLPSGGLLQQLEQFYQQSFDSYEIVPSLTIWSGPGWGFQTQQEGVPRATFVLGPLEPNFDFSDGERFENLAIHEFGHSFVNHVVLQTLVEEISQTEELFEPIKESMFPQGYQDWEICIIEHFVRAGEVLIPESMGDTATGEAILADYAENRSFIYLPFIVDQLRLYRLEQDLSYEATIKHTMDDLRAAFLEDKE